MTSPSSNSDPSKTHPEGQEGTPKPEAEAARDVHSVIEALNAENTELKDRALRALAEIENVRRRAEKDVADARTYAVSNFARDMLAVGDNMRRALESVSAEARSKSDQAIQALLDGIELTERELLKTLERHGIKKLDPRGERFDPHLHQAVFEVENSAVPAGTIGQVVAPGYTIGERVLRPALVSVTKGGPKTGAANGG
jgi:molecular chaperone GrpE